MPGNARPVVPAIDDEIVALRLCPNGAVDRGCKLRIGNFRNATPHARGRGTPLAPQVDARAYIVVDFRTDAFEKVFPMVPAGASNDDIVVHPDQAANR